MAQIGSCQQANSTHAWPYIDSLLDMSSGRPEDLYEEIKALKDRIQTLEKG